MGGYITQRMVELLIAAERPVLGARVGIVGIIFNEDWPDLRNSRVPDIVAEAARVRRRGTRGRPARRSGRSEARMLDGLILAGPYRVPGNAAIVRWKLCYDSVFRVSA